MTEEPHELLRRRCHCQGTLSCGRCKEIDRILKQRDEIKKKFNERTNNYLFLVWLGKVLKDE